MASRTKLIINYLPQNMDDKQLYEMFSPFGEIASVRVIRDSKTGYSFGYGFVNYANEDSGAKAIYQMNGFQIGNKKMKVAFSRENGDKDTNLYITNLPRDVTVDDLDRIFSPFGAIVQRSVLVDKFTQMPRGVGFVRFSKAEEAKEAMEAMNNVTLDNSSCSEPLSIKIADDHSRQKAAYYIGLMHGQKMIGRPRGRGQPHMGAGRGHMQPIGYLPSVGPSMGRGGGQPGRFNQPGRGRGGFQRPTAPYTSPSPFFY